jgi:ribosomal protein S18 acetylase RimI-like enzyme
MENQFERILQVGAEIIPAYRNLRLRGLREHPEAFGETAEAFEARSLGEISARIETQATLGSFILAAISKSGSLLGCVGLALNDGTKSRHRGTVWGMYVIPEARGRHVGRLLVEGLFARAQKLPFLEQLHLSVVTSNQAAVALYQRLGFETYGIDPQALKIAAGYFDEYLMVKQLHREKDAV